jgi:hypothetical protein|tara:strand:+ start:2266 stop:2949 length:684 start_codon:yes stop_codon:yes gene_type:complete
METTFTPRALPDKIESWSDEIEDLLSEWAEIAMCFAYLHNFSTRKYRKKYHHLQVPVIILSTLTGTANFATDSYVPVDFQKGFSAGVGALNIFCGILGTLLAFLKYAEIYEGHRIAALAWSKLSRNIEIELSLQELKRKPCRDFLKICRSEYDNLLESSPNVDLDIIGMFNKKFENKYPGVRRPIICNGLKEIKPFHHKCECPEPAPEPEPEPEPAPELPIIAPDNP